jgi:hypothetical protein
VTTSGTPTDDASRRNDVPEGTPEKRTADVKPEKVERGPQPKKERH